MKIVSSAVMRKSDRLECEKTPSKELMRRAGEAVYALIKDKEGPFAVVCGSGNNAGDGYVIASLLKRDGKECRLILAEDRFSPDGRYYFVKCCGDGIPFEKYSEKTDLTSYKCIVDCIFGTGFHGELPEKISCLTDKINSSSAYVVSVDINSGLDADSGLAKKCVHSDLTVAIGFYKYGHFLGRAKDVMKAKVCVDIGIPLAEDADFARLAEPNELKSVLPARNNFCNKGDFGYISILGGCPMYSGAVKLANLGCAALRSGCGVARVAAPASLQAALLPYMLESTFYPMKDEDGYILFDKTSLDFLLTHSAALAVGMGWGDGKDNIKILEYILKNSKIPVIIDADGLSALSRMDFNILRSASCPIILTPHPKEFSRLCKKSVEEILSSPVESAASFARENGVILLLKGSSTVITDGEVTYICDKGSPGMASAGSGDVLSGVLAGLLGYNTPSPLSVACASYVAGLAGMLAEKEVGSISAIASDTVRYIPNAIKEITEA